MVFCDIDAAAKDSLTARAPAEALRETHALLRDCVLRALRSFPGGYLLHQKDDRFRFLLAFSSPQVGVSIRAVLILLSSLVLRSAGCWLLAALAMHGSALR